MTDSEKVKIKPLENGDDYRLWRIRIEAACDARNLEDVLNRERNPYADPERKAKFASDMRKASGIIVAALSNEPLRIVRGEVGKPYSMLKKLNERYDSKSAASRISKMTELISLRYEDLSKNIGTHIDRMAGILEQLAGMNTAIPDELAIALLIASIHVDELAPIAAAVKTMPDDAATWDRVTTRLIEEQQSLKIRQNSQRSLKATKQCEICQRKHFTKDCWLNPKNPNNRLNLGNKQGKEKKKPDKKMDKSSDDQEKKIPKPKTPRAAVAKANICNTTNGTRMMLDSGTTTHMTPDEDDLQGIQDRNVSISLGDDSNVHASSKGTNAVTWNGPEGTTEVHLSETLAAKDLAMRLLSVPALTSKGMAVLFLPKKALIVDLKDNYKIIGVAHKAGDGLYYINTDGSDDVGVIDSRTDRAMMAVTRQFTDDDELDEMPALLIQDEDEESSSDESSFSDEETDDACNDAEMFDGEEERGICGLTKTKVDDIALWHTRLGHQGTDSDLRKMMDSGVLPKVTQATSDCNPCVKGKFKRFFRGSLTKESQPGRIHADLVGKVKPRSIDGYVYFLTIIDEATRYAEAMPLERKSDASSHLLQFMKRFERQSGFKLRALHTDEGSEFFKARTEFEEMGVKVTTSTPYTPSSNGLVERTQGVLISATRSCLKEARLHLAYWTDALEHVTKGRNVIIHSTTGKAPYTALFGQDADYVKHMRPFGCRALVQPVQKRFTKFEERLIEGVCLGHIDGGIYKVLTGDGILRTKHVRFYEKTFPGTTLIKGQNHETQDTADHSGHLQVEGYSTQNDDSSDGEVEHSEDVEHCAPEVTQGEFFDDAQQGADEDVPAAEPDDHTAADQVVPLTEAQLESLTHYPAYPSTFGETSNSSSHSDGESDNSDDPTWEPSTNAAIPRSISTSDEPTLGEAMGSPEANLWKQAISEEFKVLEEAGTWIQPDTTSKNSLPSGVVLRLKRDKEGRPAKFKARLVARGNLQKGSHYTQENRYAPVACFDLVRILLALSAAFGWKRHQVDIKGAFLHSFLPKKSDIWIKLPTIDGIPAADGSKVKLVKSLYGLREAPKLWYQTLSSRLLEMGFDRISTSDCLFILKKTRAIVIILVYVDDLGLFGNDKLIKFVKGKLRKFFQVTDLGESKFFLGVSIHETSYNIRLTQKPLIQRIIQLANMETCKPVKTPLPISHVLYEARVQATEADQQAMIGVPYKELLGSLLFLSTRTRPDLATAVSMLGKFAASPLPRHWNAMKHVIRYLKGTQDYGLTFRKHQGHNIQAWADADWARDEHKRRSRTGILITIGNNPIAWTSKLQKSVALSTTEAEFFALTDCIREVNWVSQICTELGMHVDKPTPVYQDNLGAIKWTEEVVGLRKVKHIRLRYHFVKEAVQQKDVEVLYIPSIENKADSLTKALGGSSFQHHRNEQNVMTSSSEGGVSQ